MKREGQTSAGSRWIEMLESRLVLSAPPVFGDIPAVINVDEGSSGMTGNFYSYTFPVTDPDTPPSGLTYRVDSMDPPGSGLGSSATYLPDGRLLFWAGDGPCLQSVTIRVTDDAGLYDTATVLFNIANVAPQFGGHDSENVTQIVGQSVGYSVDVYDRYPGDTMVVWWDFGDGVVTSPQSAAPTWRWDHGILWFWDNTSHVFTRPGNYTVRAFAQDDDGAVSTKSFAVCVAPYGVDSWGVFRIGGTPGNDNIHVSPALGGKVNLFLGGGYVGAFTANSVVAYGGSGDDVLDAAETLNVPVEFHGGPGNDLLRGGIANDILMGEEGDDRIEGRAGHDILVGDVGNDRLRGCAGCDLLLGGTGFDSLYGDGDDDIIVAGRTIYDADLNALRSILYEWTSGRPYAVRVDNIRDGSGSSVRSNSYFLNAGTTVFDDNTEDWLNGVGGNDWFFGNSAKYDKFMDRAAFEEVDVVIT